MSVGVGIDALLTAQRQPCAAGDHALTVGAARRAGLRRRAAHAASATVDWVRHRIDALAHTPGQAGGAGEAAGASIACRSGAGGCDAADAAGTAVLGVAAQVHARTAATDRTRRAHQGALALRAQGAETTDRCAGAAICRVGRQAYALSGTQRVPGVAGDAALTRAARCRAIGRRSAAARATTAVPDIVGQPQAALRTQGVAGVARQSARALVAARACVRWNRTRAAAATAVRDVRGRVHAGG